MTPPRYQIHIHARDLFGGPSRRARSNAICFRCGEHGHTRRQCFLYKVKMCQRKECDRTCEDAHDVTELRTPNVERCVRVVKDKSTGLIHMLGCGGSHTFRRCPQKRCVRCNCKGHWYDECTVKQTTHFLGIPTPTPDFLKSSCTNPCRPRLCLPADRNAWAQTCPPCDDKL